jgi:hypothetical protein
MGQDSALSILGDTLSLNIQSVPAGSVQTEGDDNQLILIQKRHMNMCPTRNGYRVTGVRSSRGGWRWLITPQLSNVYKPGNCQTISTITAQTVLHQHRHTA